MNWAEEVRKITPYILMIETNRGDGTGFIFHYNAAKSVCAIATALHVVEHAGKWKQPIRLIHGSSSKIIYLDGSDYMIHSSDTADSAVIICPTPPFELLEEPIDLVTAGTHLDIGHEVGWLGYPSIEPNSLCFFSGNISTWKDSKKEYLIDGIAFPGVSGGPVFCSQNNNSLQLAGIVTGYQVNTESGDTPRGMVLAQDVSHFHDVLQHIQSINEVENEKKVVRQQGKKGKRYTEQKQRQEAA